jgi:ABC-2 type transport system permease protein
MMRILPLIKRELYACFISPVAYVVLGVLLGIFGYFFYRSLIYYSFLSLQAGQDASLRAGVNINELIIRPLLSNLTLILVFVTPVLTMRSFAEEKKEGTLELLLSYPVTRMEVVLAKFAGALAVLLAALALTGFYMGILFLLGEPETPTILSGYLGLVLLTAAFISIGLLFSSLTENQVAAAVSAFACLLLFWTIGWSASFAPGRTGTVLGALSVYNRFENFARGVIATNDVVFFLNVTLFFLFLTYQSVKGSFWKR